MFPYLTFAALLASSIIDCQLHTFISGAQFRSITNLLNEFPAIELIITSQTTPANNEAVLAVINTKLEPLLELRAEAKKLTATIWTPTLKKVLQLHDTVPKILLYKRQDKLAMSLGHNLPCFDSVVIEAILNSDAFLIALDKSYIRLNVLKDFTPRQLQCEKQDMFLGNLSLAPGSVAYCSYDFKFYAPSTAFEPGACEKCECVAGEVQCRYDSPVACDDSTPIWLRGCCDAIARSDFCAISPCHQHATCLNLVDRAICTCNQGFTGNGTHCTDVDECLWDEEARLQLGGCSSGTSCANLPGSFRCDCLPGHQRIDPNTCLDTVRI